MNWLPGVSSIGRTHPALTTRYWPFSWPCAALLLILSAVPLAELAAQENPPPATPQAAPRHKMEDGQKVHQWIALQAYQYYKAKLPTKTVGAAPDPEMGPPNIGTIEGSLDPGDNDVLEGTADEDKGFENPFVSSWCYHWWPYVEHFCAGGDGDEIRRGLTVTVLECSATLPPGEYNSALERAEAYWDSSYVFNSTKSTSYPILFTLRF